MDRALALAGQPQQGPPVAPAIGPGPQGLAPQPGEPMAPGVPISEEEKQALLQLRRFYETMTDQARREYIKKCSKSRWFLKGSQYLSYDASSGAYRIAGTSGLPTPGANDEAVSAYVINIFSGFFLSMAQLIVANPPTEKFFPESGENPKDVAAAKAADNVVVHHQQQTDTLDELLQIWLQLWCDGTTGAYTRYVVDGDRFGYSEEPVVEPFQAQLAPDSYQCSGCPTSTPADQNAMGICPGCGAPMGAENFVPGPTVPGQRQTGTRRAPKGRVVTDSVGGLELRLPPNAKEMWQVPFLQWNVECDPSLLRSAYPHIEKEISANVPSGSAGGSVDEYERRQRVQLAKGTTTENRRIGELGAANLVTYRRTWFRSWAFAGIDNEPIRMSLQQKFPDGAYMAWADDTFCEARAEKMDDHWVIQHAMPGEGQIREPIGASLIEVQEIVNDLINIVRDVSEFTLPATFADDQVVDVDAFRRSRVAAGNLYSAHSTASKKVGEAFYEMAAGTMPVHTMEFLEKLMNEVPQFLVGAYPASYGGDLGGNDTASGIQIERDQAMGRTGMWLKRIRARYTQVMPQVVREFAENQMDPVTMSSESDGGQFEDTKIDPADLKAGKYRMRPEVAEGYPTTWAEKKNLVVQLMSNPQTAQLFTYQPNVPGWKRMLGFDGEIPGEDAWKQQLNEIQVLLQQQPIPAPMPMPGAPPFQPSVQINPVLDDDTTHIAAGQYWAASDSGQEARVQNPAGFMNVQLHIQQHQQKQAQMQAQAAMAAAPPQAPGKDSNVS